MAGSKKPIGKILVKDSPIIGACFESENRIVIVYGKGINPKFMVTTYFSDGAVIQNLELRDDRSDNLIEGSTEKEDFKQKSNPIIVIGPSDMVLPTIKMDGIDYQKDENKPFGSLLESVDGVKSEQPRVESMKNSLIQALKVQDNEQLSSILNNTQLSIVQKTVAGLPTTYVIPLLRYIITKFRSNPKFGISLIVWMRLVLIEHTSYLMTVPELVKILAELYTTIDSRVSVLDDLLKLQGRMDLLLSQIKYKKDRQTFETENVPLYVYNEEEDDNDDMEITTNIIKNENSDDNDKMSEDDDN